MAPPTADAARSASNTQGRRPVPRVIPAIPLGLSKPPRDTGTRLSNPKDSTTDTLAHRASHQPKPQPEDKKPKDPLTTAVHPPLTPDLKISDTLDGNGHVSPRDSPHEQTQSDPIEDVRNAQDPETAEQHKAVHNRPSPPHTQPKTAAVNGARQPTAIPTQLPPPFYPADHSASRSSATDRVALPAHTSGASTHRVRPSVEGIVFGAAQESPAMPSTPRETELDTNVQHQSALRPPPGFAPPQFTPAFRPGHSHHPSDAAMTWSQPGISMAPPPDAIYGNGHDHNQPTFNTGLAVYPPPNQGRLSPALGPPTANGSATSHSQSPNKSQFADVKTGSDYEDEMPAMHYPNGSGPPALRPEDSHIALAHWLSSQYGKPNLADFVLHIRSPEAILLSLPVHGIVVSRSPVIADAMQRSVPVTHPAGAPSRLVDIPTPNKFVTSEFLNEAVKFLYGAPLLSPPLFLGGLGPYDQEGEQSHTFHEARTRMAHALSYTAAGRVLQLPMLQACGTRISSALLRWDNVDQALHYGLDEFRQASSRDANGLDSLETGTGAILSCAIDFLACEFPVDFSLHSVAPELRDDPRLPTFSESRTPSHNPRLSRIRFGEAPPEEDIKATYTTRILSSILLSLPLILLERLLSHPATADRIGWAGVVKVMRDVVEEREKRRQRALKFHQASNGNVPQALVENLYYEEHVEHVTGSPIHPFQHRLTAIRLAGQP